MSQKSDGVPDTGSPDARLTSWERPGKEPRPVSSAKMTASNSTSPSGESVSDASEYERVGRYLLVREVSECRQDIEETLRFVEELATEQQAVQSVVVEDVVERAEQLRELARLMQLAGTDQAQQVEVPEIGNE